MTRAATSSSSIRSERTNPCKRQDSIPSSSPSPTPNARAFYGDLLGFDVKMMPHGGCRFRLRDMEFFLIASPQLIEGDRFSEGRIGLDHISFRAPSMDALRELAAKLQAAGIETKGVEQFKPSGNWYVAFRDPDNIQLEYWLP